MTATKPRRVRRLKVAAVVGAIALLVAGVVVAKRLRAADSADVDPDRTDESAWQKVMSGLSEGGETTVTMARQAFSLAFEQLPGVAVPSGPRDDIRSGSAALRMMVAHWDELTGHEQQTVISYLPSADSANTESGDGVVPSTEGAFEDPRTQRAGMVVFASASRTRVTPGGPVRAPRDGPDDATRNTIAARFAELQASLEARSGAALTGAVELSFNTREIVADSAAYTLPHSAGQLVTYPTPTTATLSGTSGGYAGCFVALNPRGWNSRGTDLDFILAHELYHCFEAMFIGDLSVFYDPATAPGWVIEGGANWAAAQVVPTSRYPSVFWQQYLLVPSTQLFTQTYDAIGFWNHLSEVSSIDTWTALKNALGKSSAEALAQTDAGTDTFLDSWASSLFREPSYGLAWQTDGPTMSALRFTPEQITIDDGSRVSRTALPLAKTLLKASIATDVVVIVSVGHVTLHNAAHDQANFGQLVYCARDEGCACPPGSINTSPSPDALGGREVAFGVTGSDRAAALALGGTSLADWCRKERPPTSNRPANGATAGTRATGVDSTLCHQIVERLGIDGLLNSPTLSPADIEACVAELLASGGFVPQN